MSYPPAPTFTPPVPTTAPPAAPAAPPVDRPEGITDEVWNALGDPGKAALSRERQARQDAERALAAATSTRPTPPAPAPPVPAPPAAAPQVPAGSSFSPEQLQQIVDSAVTQAVTAAVKPFQDAEQQRAHSQAQDALTKAITEAADGKFHDPTDALTPEVLTSAVVNGQVDPAKVTEALDGLLARKPHLAISADGRRYAPVGAAAGATIVNPPLETQVTETKSRMEAHAGIRPTKTS